MNTGRRDVDEPREDLGGCSIAEVMEFSRPMAIISDRFGRRIYVVRIDLWDTYQHWHAGDPARISARERTNLDENLKAMYGDLEPIQVVDDGSRVLPGVRVLADMWSEPTARNAKTHDLSGLRLCFFMWKREITIDNILGAISKLVDWDQYALDGMF